MIRLGVLLLIAMQQVAPARTATISGAVVDETGSPVGRTWLVITSADLPGARTAISAEDGRFEFTDLPAGRFRLYGSKPYYQAVEFGQRMPGDLATVIRIAAGQQLTGLRLRLARTASVRGRFVDLAGKPIAFRSWSDLGGTTEVKRLNDSAPPDTYLSFELDAGGGFKLERLRAGTYRLRATSRSPEVEVTVADGQQLSDVLVLVVKDDVPAVKSGIEGDLVGPDGHPVRGVTFAAISLDSSPPEETYLMHEPKVDDLGHFVIKDVPLGHYLLVAKQTIFSGPLTAQTYRVSWATAEVFVAEKVRGYARLVLQPGVTVRGRISVGASTIPASSIPKVSVNLLPKDSPIALGSRTRLDLSSAVSPDGSFAVSSVPPGRFTVGLWGYEDMHNLLDDWNLDSATLDGADVLAVPFTVTNQDISGLDIRISDRAGTIEGTTRNGSGDVVFSSAVVIFPTEGALRTTGSTRIRAQRPDTSGAFVFTNMPSGEYFVAPVSDIEPQKWFDPQVLSVLVPAATRVSVKSGTPVRLILTIR